MHDIAVEGLKFIDLTWINIGFLFIVGFVGGLVSGFIGSGGAFVLTPAMMSLGVPAAVAVASNMCHKFPKAMVGAYKRFKYGQVDLKLGLVMAASATVGVQAGIKIQEMILEKWGEAGSNLYVSLSFVAVLVIVGGYVFYDALKTSKSGVGDQVSSLALKAPKDSSTAHDPFQDCQSDDIFVVHRSGRFRDGSFGGNHSGGWVRRRSWNDLCGRSFGVDFIGYRVGDSLYHGLWGLGQVGYSRHGRHQAHADHPCRFSPRRSTRSYRYHVRQRAYDQGGNGDHHDHRSRQSSTCGP